MANKFIVEMPDTDNATFYCTYTFPFEVDMTKEEIMEHLEAIVRGFNNMPTETQNYCITNKPLAMTMMDIKGREIDLGRTLTYCASRGRSQYTIDLNDVKVYTIEEYFG